MTPMEQRLARRIHNQRVALRQNWEIVEMRSGFAHGKEVRSRMLASAMKHAKDARDAKSALTGLIFMLMLISNTGGSDAGK